MTAAEAWRCGAGYSGFCVARPLRGSRIGCHRLGKLAEAPKRGCD